MAYRRSPEEIVALYSQRHMARGPLIQAMERVRDAYNGDIAIPLPELSKTEDPSVPNLVAQGLDQTAMRVASMLPSLYYHPDRVGFQKWEEISRKRRLVNLSWWETSNIQLKLRRRARWLLGYACSPALIRPSRKLMSPEWHIRNPLGTFPAPTDDPDSITPADCIFAHTRSARYIKALYGEGYGNLRRYPSESDDDLLTILEYVDEEQITTICISNARSSASHSIIDATVPYSTTPSIRTRSTNVHRVIGTEDFFVLNTVRNLSEICPAVVPGRITLDKEQGQYDGIVGMYQTMAMLFALETRAVIQGVWPDTWAIARPNETVEVITEADGRAGVIGKLQGGDIKQLVENPGYMTNPTLDRLEAYQRSSAGIPAEFGGQSQSNVRTGRRGMDILSTAVDFPIQEAQVLFEKSLEQENMRAAEIDKAYFGPMRKSIYVAWQGTPSKQVDYSPADLWTSTRNTVSWTLPGTDANNLTVLMGQKRGLELISRRTALEMDPQINDAEAELDRINAEKAEDALWAWVQTQIANEMIGAEDVATLYELIITNKKSPAEAVIHIQRQAQVRQAENVDPVPPGDPAAQPGIGPPGMGFEAATVPEPTPSLQNLRAGLAALYPSQRAMQAG